MGLLSRIAESTRRVLLASRPGRAAADDRPPLATPTLGEATGRQADRIVTAPVGGGAVIGLGAIGIGEPAPGTFATYRRMRTDPTIALARMAATAPVKAADWSIEATAAAPAGAVELIEQHVLPLRPGLLGDALRMLDYGFAPFEIVWAVAGGRLVPAKLKPLLVDLTRPLVDRETGRFVGIRNADAELPPAKSLWFTHDAEAGDLFGRARHENIRETAWHAWTDTLAKFAQFAGKVAGVIPVIEYPDGTSLDAGGQEVSNQKIAETILAALPRSRGVAMPNRLINWADPTDALKSGTPLKDLRAWHLEFVDSGGSHGEQFVRSLEYLDRLKLRGWLVPERAATEGQYGTKAEAETHFNLVLLDGMDLLGDICRTLNWHLVDKVLELNFGPQARGSVYLTPAPLTDEKSALVREIVRAVLTNPASVELLLSVVDFDALLDQAGLPKTGTPATADLVRDPAAPAGNEPPQPGEDPAAQLSTVLAGVYRDTRLHLAGG